MLKYIIILILMVTMPVSAADLKMTGGKAHTWQPELLVGLFVTNTPPVKLTADLDSNIIDKNHHIIKSVQKNTEVTLSPINGKIKIDGKIVESHEIELRPQNEADLKNMQTKINGIIYPGGVKIIITNAGLSVINIVTVEEYLRGVLPKEMSPSWNEEALKAQAVAARTFSLKNRKRHSAAGYDLCNTSHCQIYGGIATSDENTDKAISKTFGEVLFYNNKLIEAAFHADSGGMTENAVDVWGTDYAYLRAVPELETKTEAWTERIEINKFSNKLAAAKKNVGKVQFIKSTNLEIGKLTSDRSTSGRVKEVTIIGDKGEIKLSGTQMRSIFGLKSTLFEIGISSNEVVINGYGRGHGVGMSQIGANTFAEHKYTYEQILAHYYKGVVLKRLY